MNSNSNVPHNNSHRLNIWQAILGVSLSYLIIDFVSKVLSAGVDDINIQLPINVFKGIFILALIGYLVFFHTSVSNFQIFFKTSPPGLNTKGFPLLVGTLISIYLFITICYLSVNIPYNVYMLFLFTLLWPAWIFSFGLEQWLAFKKSQNQTSEQGQEGG